MNRFWAMIVLTAFGCSPSSQSQAADPEIKITGTFEPATAKPGETVTLKIKVELEKGWHTYPTVQEEKAAEKQVNRITFKDGPIVFVDKVVEPADPDIVAEPILEIKKMHIYHDGGIWERKAVVPPNAKPGELEADLIFTILVCNEKNCLPSKKIDLKVPLKVHGDPMPVDPKFREAVEKAMKAKKE